MAGDAQSMTFMHEAAEEQVREREPLVTAATLWALAAFVTVGLFSLAQDSLPVFVAFVTFGGGGMLIARLSGTTAMRVYLVVFGVAACCSVALYLYFDFLYGVPYLLGGSDELHYDEMGTVFAQTMGLFDYTDIRGNLVALWHNSVAYIYVVGVLYKFALLFGEVHTMVPRLFNVTLLALTAVGIYRIGTKLELQPRLAIVCALFAGCLPMMVYVSVQTLRDILVTALIVVVVDVWTQRPGRKLSIVKAGLITLLMAALLIDLRRPQALAALVIGGIGFLASDVGRRPSVWIPVLATFIVAGVGAFVVLSSFISTELLFLLGQSEYYDAYRVDEVGGGLSSVVFTTPPPLGWLLRIGYALMSPIPEMSLEIDKMWVSSGTVIHIMFVPFLFAGFAATARRRNWWPVLGAMLILFMGMAMFTFQGRHIVQYLPLAVLIAAAGYEAHARTRRAILTVTAAIGGVLAFTYLLLKI